MIKDVVGRIIKIDWRTLNDLQPSNLKLNTNKAALKDSILKYGFVRPFAVWENKGELFCIDGHFRKQLLHEFSDSGEVEVPKKLSAIEIKAETKAEAIKILLNVYNSKVNYIGSEELNDWMKIEYMEVGEVDMLNIEDTTPEPVKKERITLTYLQAECDQIINALGDEREVELEALLDTYIGSYGKQGK